MVEFFFLTPSVKKLTKAWKREMKDDPWEQPVMQEHEAYEWPEAQKGLSLVI